MKRKLNYMKEDLALWIKNDKYILVISIVLFVLLFLCKFSL